MLDNTAPISCAEHPYGVCLCLASTAATAHEKSCRYCNIMAIVFYRTPPTIMHSVHHLCGHECCFYRRDGTPEALTHVRHQVLFASLANYQCSLALKAMTWCSHAVSQSQTPLFIFLPILLHPHLRRMFSGVILACSMLRLFLPTLIISFVKMHCIVQDECLVNRNHHKRLPPPNASDNIVPLLLNVHSLHFPPL